MPKDGKIRGFLPQFYRTEVGPTVTRTGVWDDRGDEAFLEMLIHAMPSGTDLMLADLVSLPHVWGQTLAFTVAWRDENHPMHLTVRGEWRGLLALVGLAGWEDWPVSVVEVNLAKLADRPFKTSTGPTSDDPAGEPRPNFPKVVMNSMPDNAAIGAPLWKNSAVVLYDRNSVSRPERSSDARPVAFCAPRRLGARAITCRPGCEARRLPTTSAASAICGMVAGGTKLATSISGIPASAMAAIQRSFTPVGIGDRIICRPSRGPTSRTVTAGFLMAFLIRP